MCPLITIPLLHPEVNSVSAAPWFGKPGMGTQYQLPMSIDELVG
ncbi:DUF4237 domain-containing protein [Pseudomonas lini]|uniref:DUF4237 domain-containing protein n=1 Tax=Pseudomonas lini TaxID=163011 RepID=A0A7V7TRU5_9PSED|nr:DUF4237 domain-containing protein [Pseudomonas lini]